MQASPNPAVINIIPILFMFGVVYFLIIRPQQKMQKEHEAMIASLKKNDEVITRGGLHGTIVNIKEDTFVLRMDESVRIEIDKGAVATLKRKKDD